jgi:hypothetical protein
LLLSALLLLLLLLLLRRRHCGLRLRLLPLRPQPSASLGSSL